MDAATDDSFLDAIAQAMLGDDGDCDFCLPDKPGEFSLPLGASGLLPVLDSLTSGSHHSSVTQKDRVPDVPAQVCMHTTYASSLRLLHAPVLLSTPCWLETSVSP